SCQGNGFVSVLILRPALEAGARNSNVYRRSSRCNAGSSRNLDGECRSVSTQALPAMWCPARNDVRRLGDVAPVRKLPTSRRNRSNGSLLSVACAGLRHVLPSAAAGVRQTRTHLYRICLFFLIFHLLGSTRAPVLRNCRAQVRPRAKEQGGRA